MFNKNIKIMPANVMYQHPENCDGNCEYCCNPLCF